MNNEEMKIIALREGFKLKIAEIYDTYEDKVADLRVQLTVASNRADSLQQEVDRLTAELTEIKEVTEDAAMEKKAAPNA